MDRYREAMQEFYRVYTGMKKEHRLRMESHFDVYGNNWIGIYERVAQREERCVCMVNEEEDVLCYQKAASVLKMHSWEREEKEMKAG